MPTVLEEKDAIRDVLSEYCDFADDGLRAAMAELFTPDGTEPRAVHIVGNVVIKIEGARARLRSNRVEPHNSRRGPVVEAAGAYDDEMIKLDGNWLFRHRRIDRFVADTRGPAHAK